MTMYFELDARDVTEPRTPMVGAGRTDSVASPMVGEQTGVSTSPMVGGELKPIGLEQ